ncbi:MAG: DinB family protein [Terracidiphilus sp.]
MSVGITLQELLTWNGESSSFWNTHLEANPHLLALACDIGGTTNVQEFVRHIWGVELRWNQRLAGLPVTPREDFPAGPLDALFELHTRADAIFRDLLAAPDESWEQSYVLEMGSLPAEARSMSRRKIAVHALFHSQRHWAQLATLVRSAGFPSGFKGDLLFSRALR